jgi:hypothetical protein
MGTVLAVQEPLPLLSLIEMLSPALKQLGCGSKSGEIVKSVLEPLGSLLSGISQSTTPISPLHTSLYDFLKDENCSKEFFVNSSLQNLNLTKACFEVMKGLKFNMCKLETSYKANKDQTVNTEAIKHHMSYSCRFWAVHLQNTDFNIEVCTEINYMMHENLLYWLEVLSLIESIDTGFYALQFAIEWIKVKISFFKIKKMLKYFV